MVHSHLAFQYGLSFLYLSLVYIVVVNILLQVLLQLVELDTHCLLEVAEEIQSYLRIGGLPVEQRMGRNRDYMECSLEGNEIYASQLVDERQGQVAE